MNPAAEMEINRVIRDLQAAEASIVQVVDGLQRDFQEIGAAQCIRCLRYLSANCDDALRGVRLAVNNMRQEVLNG